MKCKDCFHYDVCTKLTRVVAFGRDIDVDCDNFATDNNVGDKWISVKDRLPDTAARVLVCRTWLGTVLKPVYGYYQDFPNQKGCWYILTEEGYYPQREVTHWMPLPEPPKEENDG